MPEGGDVTGQVSPSAALHRGQRQSSGKQRELPWEMQILNHGSKERNLRQCEENQDLQPKKVKWKTLEEDKDWQCVRKEKTIPPFLARSRAAGYRGKCLCYRGKWGSEGKRKLGKINKKVKASQRAMEQTLFGFERRRTIVFQGQHMGEK